MSLNRMGKRSAKLLFLLISASLITTASAAVYYAILMESNVTVSGAPVHFTDGNDSVKAGYSPGTNDTYAHLTGLKAYPNVTLTYEQAVNITNTDGPAHNIRLRHVSITPASGDGVGNFTSITFYLINTTGGVEGTLTYTVSGGSWVPPSSETDWASLPGGNTEWTIKIVTVAVAGAKSNVSTSITIAIDVE